MIVKFRIEARDSTSEKVREQMETLALHVIAKTARDLEIPLGEVHWECTAEVITGSGETGYQGRMSFAWRERMD